MIPRGYMGEVARLGQGEPLDVWSVAAGPSVARAVALGIAPPDPDAPLRDPELRRHYRARYGCFSGRALLEGDPTVVALSVAVRDDDALYPLVSPWIGGALFGVPRESRRTLVATLPAALRAPTVRGFERLREQVPDGLASGLSMAVQGIPMGLSAAAYATQLLGRVLTALYPAETALVLGARGMQVSWCLPLAEASLAAALSLTAMEAV